jgi:thiaminase (transcriptional activator TenA)
MLPGTFFLESFARAYAFALARSPVRGGLDAFHALTGGVLDELQLHAGYAERLGIDLARVEPLDSTVAYTDFLLATAATAGVGNTVLSKAYPVLAHQTDFSGIGPQ